MKIGELARAAQCTAETVRSYEKERLLPAPERSAANYRCHGQAHLDRLRFIRNCRALAMTHEEIRALLGLVDEPPEDCGAFNRLLDAHIDHADARIEELLQLKRQLAALRLSCQTERSVGECAILHGLAAMDARAKPAKSTHLG